MKLLIMMGNIFGPSVSVPELSYKLKCARIIVQAVMWEKYMGGFSIHIKIKGIS